MDPLFVESLVTLVNAIAAGVALIIHAWNHSHTARVTTKHAETTSAGQPTAESSKTVTTA
jgi:hypothetical protein